MKLQKDAKTVITHVTAAVVGWIVSLFVTSSTVIEATYNGTMAACNFMN